MKQHITSEQLNELSERGKERLRDWWIPQTGDTAMSEKTGNWNLVGGYQLNKVTAKRHFYPLLSIGQMIEFLLGHKDTRHKGDIDLHEEMMLNCVGGNKADIFLAWNDQYYEEFCDALWEACKEELGK